MRATVIKFIAFIVVCMVFTVYLAFTIGNIRPSHLWFFHKDYALSAYFDDVTGLNKGDNVKVAGVIVGKVDSIKVVNGPGGKNNGGNDRALVKFQVHKSVKVPANSTASIRWRNLIGQRYVYLTPPPGDQAAPVVLKNGDTVTKTIAVVDIGELFNELGPIVRAMDPAKVNTFLDAFTGALSGNEGNLQSAIDNLATITASLASHDDAIGRLVGNLDTVAATLNNRDAEIRTVLDNLVALSQTFSDNTQIVDDSITQMGTVSVNIDRLLANNRAQIDRILANLNKLLGVVQSQAAAGQRVAGRASDRGHPDLLGRVLGRVAQPDHPVRRGPERAEHRRPVLPCNTRPTRPGPGLQVSSPGGAAADRVPQSQFPTQGRRHRQRDERTWRGCSHGA